MNLAERLPDFEPEPLDLPPPDLTPPHLDKASPAPPPASPFRVPATSARRRGRDRRSVGCEVPASGFAVCGLEFGGWGVP